MKKDFEIKTKRLVLKPLGMKYIDSVHEYASDPENTRYMLYLPNSTYEETKAFLTYVDEAWEHEDEPTYECALLLGDEQKHIGAVSLTVENGVGELGWILNKRYWGQGYMSEAATALLDFAVKDLGIRHFVAHCDADNPGSYRVMEKIGMTLVDKTPGRKNRLTPPDEERFELCYKLDI